MQLTCCHCEATLEFSDRRPSFCPYCGKPVAPDPSTESWGDLAHPGSEAATLAPTPPRASRDGADPEVLGGYRLLRVLGVGGMGKVYEAEDVKGGRRVALKLVSADYARSPEAVERFRQEGRLASQIAHPRCVFVLAADEDAGRPYIVMELMPGDNLDDYVRRHGPLPLDKAIAMVLDVIDGLNEAHRIGVIHRDVKPSNCFFGAGGRLKIGDFGLAKSLVQDAHLTKTGLFLGTPLYASPEQVRGEALDAQTDVYSIAATLYYMLTGRAPFQSDNAAITLARIAADPAPSMRTLRPELPAELDAVVLRGLERDRKRRWPNLDEFAQALRPFLPGPRPVQDLFVRYGACLIDGIILYPVVLFGQVVIRELPGFFGTEWGAGAPEFNSPVFTPLVVVLPWLYFGMLEGWWGRSVGKWVLSFRVQQASTGHRPGLGRALLRAFVFSVLFRLNEIGIFVGSLILGLPLNVKRTGLSQDYLLLAGAGLLLGAVGVCLLLGTMRRRNGYRGLHEFLSGTRTVKITAPKKVEAVFVGLRSQKLAQATDLPVKVGPYTVQGALTWGERAKVLVGSDPVLNRQVALWLRPAPKAPLGAARRDLNRVMRPRWLATGRQGELQWDAFALAEGASLTTLVADSGRMPWAQVRPILQQLADELVLAEQHGTVPAQLAVEQVWLRSDGRVVLCDFPTADAADAGAKDKVVEGSADEISEVRSLHFLGRVALLSLEGRHPPSTLPPAVRVPLPVPAWNLLRDVLCAQNTQVRLREVRDRLSEMKNKATVLTRYRRIRQLLLDAVLLFAMVVCGLCVVGAVRIALQLGTDAEYGKELSVVVLSLPAVTALLAFVCRGGLGLALLRIAVVRDDGRFLCAGRSLLVWAPVAVIYLASLLVTPGSWFWAFADRAPDWASPMAAFLQGLVVILLGAYFVLGIWYPRRGFHDHLAGTHLVPG
jgi:hypothetical protein